MMSSLVITRFGEGRKDPINKRWCLSPTLWCRRCPKASLALDSLAPVTCATSGQWWVLLASEILVPPPNSLQLSSIPSEGPGVGIAVCPRGLSRSWMLRAPTSWTWRRAGLLASENLLFEDLPARLKLD